MNILIQTSIIVILANYSNQIENISAFYLLSTSLFGSALHHRTLPPQFESLNV